MAKQSIGALAVDLKADTASFTRDLNKASGSLRRSSAQMKRNTDLVTRSLGAMKKMAGGLKLAIGALIGTSVVAGLKKITDTYAEQERQVRAVNAALRATGRFSTEASIALQKNASDIQKLTTFGDEAILEATAVLAQFAQKLTVEELGEAQKAVVALSSTLKMDLKSAALTLGKSIGSQTNALMRYGIQLDTTATQGDKLRAVTAQTNAMFEQLKETTDTLEGRQIQLKNAFGDLLEVMGGILVDGFDAENSINSMTEAITGLTEEMEKNREPAVRLVRGFQFIGTSLIDLSKTIVLGMKLLIVDGFRLLVAETDLQLVRLNGALAQGFNDLRNRAGIFKKLIPDVVKQRDQTPVINRVLAAREAFDNAKAAAQAPLGDISKNFQNIFAPLRDRGGSVRASAPVLGLLDGLSEKSKEAKHSVSGVSGVVREFMDIIEKESRGLAEFSAEVKPSFDFDIKFSKTQEVLANTRTELERYNDELKTLKTLLSEGFINEDTFNRAVKQLDDLKNGTNEFTRAIEHAAGEFGDRFFDTFTQGLKDGKIEFKSFAASILEDLAKLIFKLTVTIPLAEALSGALSGRSIGGLFKNIGSKLLGGFIGGGISGKVGDFGGGVTFAASGATASAGQPFVVGERGPEFFVPKTAGTILPNGTAPGGGGVTVNQTFSFTVMDSRGVKEVLAREAPFIQRMTMDALQKNENRKGRFGPMDNHRSAR